MKALPQSIREKAYVSPDAKELAWKRNDLPEALREIAGSGQAILGGEVWFVENSNLNWCGLIPDRAGGPPGVWSWETTSKEDGELWQAYCERSYQESLIALEGINVEESAAQEAVPFLWFNVCYVEPDEA